MHLKRSNELKAFNVTSSLIWFIYSSYFCLICQQPLDILDGDLPDTTVDLLVTGGEAIMFGSNSLSRLKDCRQIRVSGAKLVALRRLAAHNLNVVSAYLDIDNCDVLRIEEKTFSNIKGKLLCFGLCCICDYYKNIACDYFPGLRTGNIIFFDK